MISYRLEVCRLLSREDHQKLYRLLDIIGDAFVVDAPGWLLSCSWFWWSCGTLQDSDTMNLVTVEGL
jgi:hypothetical protein